MAALEAADTVFLSGSHYNNLINSIANSNYGGAGGIGANGRSGGNGGAGGGGYGISLSAFEL